MTRPGLEQGKTLLSNIDAAPSSSMSIADELGGMSDFQVRASDYVATISYLFLPCAALILLPLFLASIH